MVCCFSMVVVDGHGQWDLLLPYLFTKVVLFLQKKSTLELVIQTLTTFWRHFSSLLSLRAFVLFGQSWQPPYMHQPKQPPAGLPSQPEAYYTCTCWSSSAPFCSFSPTKMVVGLRRVTVRWFCEAPDNRNFRVEQYQFLLGTYTWFLRTQTVVFTWRLLFQVIFQPGVMQAVHQQSTPHNINDEQQHHSVDRLLTIIWALIGSLPSSR